MLVVQTTNITVCTKYYVNNRGGHWYQRRIPLPLRKFYVDVQGNERTHIKIKLSNEYNTLQMEIARLAKQHNEEFAALRNTKSNAHLEAQALAVLSKNGVWPGAGLEKATVPEGMYEFPHLDYVEDYLRDRKQSGTLTEADKLAQTLLIKPMPLVLSKLVEIYLDHHPKGATEKFKRNTLKRYKNVITVLGNLALEKLNRAQANKYVADRLRNVSTATVKREVNTIKAVINVVLREKEIVMNNPFDVISIQGFGKDVKPRLPFTNIELQLVISNCLERADDMANILLVCALTGCRLSEAAGLRREDVHLDAVVPFVAFKEYGLRSLKTRNSARDVPMLPILRDALTKQLFSHTATVVFPKFANGHDVKSEEISKSLRGFIKTDLGIVGKTTHSTRHSYRDLMREAKIPDGIAEVIGGWSSGGIASKYGSGHTLEHKLEVMTAAYTPILDQFKPALRLVG